MKRLRLKIKGRVQGVWYRQSTADEALGMGVAGWVMNLPDGSVEAVFEGEEGAVDAMVEWCKKGPPMAAVTGVAVSEEPPEGLKPPFTVRRRG